MDTDIIITSPLGLVDDTKDLGLTPRLPYRTDIHGKYNAGWIFVNNKKFPHWWRSEIARSSFRFIEQKCLNDAPKHFDVFHFPPTYNLTPDRWVSWYTNRPRRRTHYLLRFNSNIKKDITYKNKPIISFHYRFNDTNLPLYYFIMNHLYKGSPELFRLINSRINNPISSKFLVKSQTYALALQVNKQTTLAIIRNISFLYSDYTKFPHTSIKRYYYKLVREIATFILYPFYLISEGIYFYHATNRLTNRKLSKQKFIKILTLSFCQPRRLLYFYQLSFWRKKKISPFL